jgi:alkanesulfonate monooxygenase SsuD/methylene tetrahydromethanopterin reductase-like flavin-dependent oxidoreductase (luciferase family)
LDTKHRRLACIGKTVLVQDIAGAHVVQRRWARPNGVQNGDDQFAFGDPDSVGEQLTAVKATGVDGFTINLAVNGHQTDRIGLLGEIANKALG